MLTVVFEWSRIGDDIYLNILHVYAQHFQLHYEMRMSHYHTLVCVTCSTAGWDESRNWYTQANMCISGFIIESRGDIWFYTHNYRWTVIEF